MTTFVSQLRKSKVGKTQTSWFVSLFYIKRTNYNMLQSYQVILDRPIYFKKFEYI